MLRTRLLWERWAHGDVGWLAVQSSMRWGPSTRPPVRHDSTLPFFPLHRSARSPGVFRTLLHTGPYATLWVLHHVPFFFDFRLPVLSLAPAKSLGIHAGNPPVRIPGLAEGYQQTGGRTPRRPTVGCLGRNANFGEHSPGPRARVRRVPDDSPTARRHLHRP